MKRLWVVLLLPMASATWAQIAGPPTWKPPVTAGHCTEWLKAGVLEDAGAACGSGGGGGTVNPAAQYSVPYYSASGTADTLSGLNSPTSGPGYFSLRFDPTSTSAVIPTADQLGANVRSINGTASTDTVLYSDVLGLVVHDKAGSAAVTETLPTPTSLNNTQFAYNYCNNSSYTDTIVPTTWTIALNNGSAGSSVSVSSGACVQVTVDPYNSDQWDAISYGAASSGSGTVNSGTVGQLTYYGATGTAVSGTADASISNGALSLGASGTVGSVAMGNATSGTVTLQPVTGALGTVTASLPANTGTVAELNLSQDFTAGQTIAYAHFNGASAASTANVAIPASPYTSGTGTTNWPTLYLNPGGTAPTTFSTSGTEFGVNAPSGFTGNIFDFYVNGTEEALLSSSGVLRVSGTISQGTVFTLGTGTGACATSSTLVGGATVGSFICTGTAGASTIIVNLPTATHGWVCDPHDITTVADTLALSAETTTSASFSGTVAANDEIVFKCSGF